MLLNNYLILKLIFTKVKINFHKRDHDYQGSQLFGRKIGSYPFRYLGIPMHYRKLSNKDWKAIEDRIEKKTKWMERKILIRRGAFGPNKFCSL